MHLFVIRELIKVHFTIKINNKKIKKLFHTTLIAANL